MLIYNKQDVYQIFLVVALEVSLCSTVHLQNGLISWYLIVIISLQYCLFLEKLFEIYIFLKCWSTFKAVHLISFKWISSKFYMSIIFILTLNIIKCVSKNLQHTNLKINVGIYHLHLWHKQKIYTYEMYYVILVLWSR